MGMTEQDVAGSEPVEEGPPIPTAEGLEDALDAEHDAAAMADTPEDPDEVPRSTALEREPEPMFPALPKLVLPDGREIVPDDFELEVSKFSVTIDGRALPEEGREVDLFLRAKVGPWALDGKTLTIPAKRGGLVRVRLVPLKAPQPSLFDRPANVEPVDVDAILGEHLATCEDCLVDDWGGLTGEGCATYQELVERYSPAPGEGTDEGESAALDDDGGAGDSLEDTGGIPASSRPQPHAYPGTECANPDVVCGHPRLKHKGNTGRCAEIVRPGLPDRYCACQSFVEPEPEPGLD